MSYPLDQKKLEFKILKNHFFILNKKQGSPYLANNDNNIKNWIATDTDNLTKKAKALFNFNSRRTPSPAPAKESVYTTKRKGRMSATSKAKDCLYKGEYLNNKVLTQAQIFAKIRSSRLLRALGYGAKEKDKKQYLNKFSSSRSYGPKPN